MHDQSPPRSFFRSFLDSEAAGGIVLMGAAALALVISNSSLAEGYFSALEHEWGPLSLLHWINDALMAVFFLFVGLEIKREMLVGQLSTTKRRLLPGIAALGGMAVPGIIYALVNWSRPELLHGWAVPTATDIAFSIGVLSLLGSRVPTSLKVFLTALAIIDDLGAVMIIALFYSTGLSLPDLGAAALVLVLLVVLNRRGVMQPWPYLLLGVVLWVFVLRSGVHATLAGVALALTIPLYPAKEAREDDQPPLRRIEHALSNVVPFVIVPIFGFANAGVTLLHLPEGALTSTLTLGIIAGLVVGKTVGVFGASWLAIKLRVADMPFGSSWLHFVATAMLCGIGFTMSLFIGLLAFGSSPELEGELKLGIIVGSVVSALLGSAMFVLAGKPAEDERRQGA